MRGKKLYTRKRFTLKVILMVGTLGVKQKYFERLPKNGHTLKSNQVVNLATIIDPVQDFRLPKTEGKH